MRASKLKNPGYHRVLHGTTPVGVNSIVREGDEITLSGHSLDNCRDIHTWTVAADADVVLCNYFGVPIEGKSRAEIEADTVIQDLVKYGIEHTVEVEECYGQRLVKLHIKGRSMYDDSLYLTWYTRIEGRRKTSGFLCGTLFRGIAHSKKVKSHVQISRKEGLVKVNSIICSAHYRLTGEVL